MNANGTRFGVQERKGEGGLTKITITLKKLPKEGTAVASKSSGSIPQRAYISTVRGALDAMALHKSTMSAHEHRARV